MFKPTVSVLNKYRMNVQENCISASGMYQLLTTRSGNRKWRYICKLDTKGHPNYHYLVPEEKNQICADAVTMLREYGVGKLFLKFPWFFLVTDGDLMLSRFCFGENLLFVYDIHNNKILMDERIAHLSF